MVGVSGFEPEASWTRTKRDTKLRHTPMQQYTLYGFFARVSRRIFVKLIAYFVLRTKGAKEHGKIPF